MAEHEGARGGRDARCWLAPLPSPLLLFYGCRGRRAGDAMLAAMRKDGGRKEGRWGIKDGREEGILASFTRCQHAIIL